VEGSCEQGDELSGSIKCWDVLGVAGIFLEGKGRSAGKADNLAAIREPIV
jgi:hypothetical protein